MPPYSSGMCGSQSPHSCACLRMWTICSISTSRLSWLASIFSSAGRTTSLQNLRTRATTSCTSSGKLKSMAMAVSSVRRRRLARQRQLLLPVDDQLAAREAPGAVGATTAAILVADAPVELQRPAVALEQVVREAVGLADGVVAGELEELVVDRVVRGAVALDRLEAADD